MTTNTSTGTCRDSCFDVAVIGAGPAGLSAAASAAAAGAATICIDGQRRPGGQYYRQPAGAAAASADRRQRSGAALYEAAVNAGSGYLPGTGVWGLSEDPHTMAVRRVELVTDGRLSQVSARSIVVAAGARERCAAFPGWTLPGVLTAGGVQALYKQHRIVPGKRILLAAPARFCWSSPPRWPARGRGRGRRGGRPRRRPLPAASLVDHRDHGPPAGEDLGGRAQRGGPGPARRPGSHRLGRRPGTRPHRGHRGDHRQARPPVAARSGDTPLPGLRHHCDTSRPRARHRSVAATRRASVLSAGAGRACPSTGRHHGDRRGPGVFAAGDGAGVGGAAWLLSKARSRVPRRRPTRWARPTPRPTSPGHNGCGCAANAGSRSTTASCSGHAPVLRTLPAPTPRCAAARTCRNARYPLRSTRAPQR
ncbi:FAD-dependent oxidoreductase [Actinomadura madurae]|uniref:FAD-dependent oxidoreductase n=1 Tax=Actinomadura madurae TaxID=1993 RepID=UPI003558054F